MESNNQFSPIPNPVPQPIIAEGGTSPKAMAPSYTPTPASSPAPQMKPEMKSISTGTSSMSSPIWLGVAVIIILIVAYFLWSSSGNKVNKTTFSSENVVVKTTNVAVATEAEKLPAGFLKSIPVETTYITESTTLTYPERKAVLYSVSYFSTKQQQEIFTIYGNFLKENGYKITNTNKSASYMMYQATKDNNDITVVITPQPDRIMVQVSYVVRG